MAEVASVTTAEFAINGEEIVPLFAGVPAATGWPRARRGWPLQVYVALIAAQVLVLFSGTRPNRRQMEAIQFYLLAWASAAETAALIARYGTA